MLHKMLGSQGLAMINLPEKEPVIQLVLLRLTTVVCRGPRPVANNISKGKTAAVSVWRGEDDLNSFTTNTHPIDPSDRLLAKR